MATVFDKILDTTTGPKSYDWYRKKVRSMTTPSARTLIRQGKATIRPKYGIMNLFGYDPKWKAFVNGQETKIIRANHAFQGILLPVSGTNRIEVIYSDPVLRWTFLAIPFGILMIFIATRDVLNNHRGLGHSLRILKRKV